MDSAILKTETDGRLYAIAMLDALAYEECEEGFSWYTYSADEEDGNGKCSIYRKSPQGDALKRWLDDLYLNATAEARNGFFVVFTDFIGSVLQGVTPNPPAEYYQDLESKGLLPAWGSVTYLDPLAAQAALARGDVEYRPRPGSRRVPVENRHG